MTRRQSPAALAALAVATLALVVALGGSVYAAAAINGRNLVNQSVTGLKLKNGTITGIKLKDNTVTGRQVNEATLSGLARTSNFRRIKVETTTGSTVQRPVLTLGALQLQFLCQLAGGSTVWALSARSASGETGWDLQAVRHGSSSGAAPLVDGGIFSASSTTLATGGATSGGFGREVGTIVFNNDTRRETVSVDFAVFVNSNGSVSYCNLAGTAVRTAS